MLNCAFENADSISWTLNGGELPASTVIRNAGTQSKVRIRSVSKIDYGKYVASAKNSFGISETSCVLSPSNGEVEHEARVTSDLGYVTQSQRTTEESAANEDPVISPAPPSVSSLENTRLKEGDKLTLEVQVTSVSNFSVEWLCNGQIFQPDADNMTVIETDQNSSKLILDDVNDDDSGLYNVKVTNESGTVEAQCEVIVDKAPQARA